MCREKNFKKEKSAMNKLMDWTNEGVKKEKIW